MAIPFKSDISGINGRFNNLIVNRNLTVNNILTLALNKYANNNQYGLDANNSDIVGVNGIYFNDLVDDEGEGINFVESINEQSKAYNTLTTDFTNPNILTWNGDAMRTTWFQGAADRSFGLAGDDRRKDNPEPEYYYKLFRPKSYECMNNNDGGSLIVTDFMEATALSKDKTGNYALNTFFPGANTYVNMITYIPWGDKSGGHITQKAISETGQEVKRTSYTEKVSGTDTKVEKWGPWTSIFGEWQSARIPFKLTSTEGDSLIFRVPDDTWKQFCTPDIDCWYIIAENAWCTYKATISNQTKYGMEQDIGGSLFGIAGQAAYSSCNITRVNHGNRGSISHGMSSNNWSLSDQYFETYDYHGGECLSVLGSLHAEASKCYLALTVECTMEEVVADHAHTASLYDYFNATIYYHKKC